MSVQNPILIQFINNVTNQTFTDSTMAGAQWDFQGASGTDCQDGKFITNNATYEGTTLIHISSLNVQGSDSSYIRQVGVGNLIRFTDADGKTAAFLITSLVPAEEDEACNLIGVVIGSGSGNWGGRYVVDFQPGTGA